MTHLLLSPIPSPGLPRPTRRRRLTRLRRLHRHCARGRARRHQSAQGPFHSERPREAERAAGAPVSSCYIGCPPSCSRGVVNACGGSQPCLWSSSCGSSPSPPSWSSSASPRTSSSVSDLEYDYINPYDSSSRINAVVLIEYSLQAALCTSFLLTLHWFPFLVMAPVTYYHVKLYLARKHLVDVTEIFRQLSGEKKYRMIKLAFYFCLFIITIYRLVMTAVMLFTDEDINLVETRTI